MVRSPAGQRFSSVRAFRDEEQSCARRFGSLGEQIRLDQTGDFDIEWDSAFLAALAHHPNPAGADVDVGSVQGQ